MEADRKPIVTIGIVQLLKNLDLEADFDQALILTLNSRNLGRGTDALLYGHTKLDELSAYVDANKRDGTTVDELKVSIKCWIDNVSKDAQGVLDS